MEYQEILEIVGYAASVLIVISVMMSSIIKLRILNLTGAALFSAYGFLIDSYPVGILNGFVVLVNAYYLVKYYAKNEDFKLLTVKPQNEYLSTFLEAYQKDIYKFFPFFKFDPEKEGFYMFILRNVNIAGVIVAHKKTDDVIHIDLDYVLPEYRDFKIGRFVFSKNRNIYKKNGIKKIQSYSMNNTHSRYLKKVGFEEGLKEGQKIFVLDLDK